MKKLAILASCCAGAIAHANTATDILSSTFANTGVAVNASTLGVGLDLSKAVYKDYLTVRFNANYLPLSMTAEQVNANLVLNTYGLLLDYQPFAGNFRLSGGLYYNNNSFSGTAKPDQSITLNGVTYQASDFTDYSAKVDFTKFAPYIGIGYGAGAVTSNARKGFFFKTDVGMMYAKPNLSVNAQCASSMTASQCQEFQFDLQEQIKSSQSTLNILSFYPVVNLGLGYRF